MGLDDRSADRQAHAHAAGFGSEECVEQPVGILGGQSDAAIAYRDQNLAGFLLVRPDHQLAQPVRDRLHRFDAVDDEIEDDLLQLDPVAEDQAQGRGELHPQRHPVADQLVMQQGDHLVDDFIDVERHFLIGGLVDQRADALDHFARPVAVLDDGLHRAARLFQVRRVAVEPALAGRGVGDNGGQRLVHLMGDRGGELAQSASRA